jgi:hypothetical protein
VRLLKALDRNRRVTTVPFQKSGVPSSVGLTVEECEASAWAIAPDGGRYRGAEAMNALVAAALGSAVPLLVYYLPGNCRTSSIPLWPPTAADCLATDPTAPNTPPSADNGARSRGCCTSWAGGRSPSSGSARSCSGSP